MREILSINLSVGRSCFIQCNGCYNHFGKTSFLTKTDHILSFLRKAKGKGISKVTLCGGDPLSRPDIVELVGEIKNLGYYITLDTVGTAFLGNVQTIFFGNNIIPRIDPLFLAEKIDLIGIPLDGANNAEMAYFRTGRENIFDEQLKIIDLLKEARAKVCVNTVVNKGNVNGIKQLCSQVENILPIEKWQLFQFMPIGPLGSKNRALYEITDEQFAYCQAEVIEYFLKKNFIENIEFKAKAERKGNYMLIDANGSAWIPDSTITSLWYADQDSNGNRFVLGSLSNEDDHERILDAIMNPKKLLEFFDKKANLKCANI